MHCLCRKREFLQAEIRSLKDRNKELEEMLAKERKKHLTSGLLPSPHDIVKSPLSLTGENTPPMGSSSARASSAGSGMQPRPDVKDWIKKAREAATKEDCELAPSSGASGDDSETNGGVFGFEDEDGEYVDEDGRDASEGYSVVEHLDEGGRVIVEGPGDDESHYHDGMSETSSRYPPPPSSHSGASDDENTWATSPSVRHRSPASTTTERERKHGSGHSARARSEALPLTVAVPFGLFSHLAGQATRARSSLSPSASRAGSIEKDAMVANGSGSTTKRSGSGNSDGSTHLLSPGDAALAILNNPGSKQSTVITEGTEVTVQIKREEDEDDYGAAGRRFFEPRRGSLVDPNTLAPARHPVPHILMRGIVTPQEAEKLFTL